MINVYYWTRRNGKPTQACFPAVKVDRASNQSIRFAAANGEKLTVKRADIIAIVHTED